METKKDAITPPAWRRRLSYFFYALIYLLIGAGVFWLAFRFSDGMESFERGQIGRASCRERVLLIV